MSLSTRSHDRLSFIAIALVALALPLEAQRFDTLVKNVGAPMHAGTGRLIPELTIGGANATGDEYLFESIKSLFAASDGTVWVVDGGAIGKYAVRRYDHAGAFLRNIGRRGDGPGEWQSPDNIAQLRDGRTILRDAVVGRSLTFYKPNGDFDTTWAYATSAIFSMRVDSSNAIWLRMRPGAGLYSPFPITTIRVGANGKMIDTVPEPAPLPTFAGASFKVTNERSTTINVPYQPRGMLAWSPHGYYARGVTSRYAVDLLLPRALPNGGNRPWRPGDRVVSIRSNAAAVPITDAERADQTAYMNAQADAFGGTRSGPTPSVPRMKPFLRGITFDMDGRLWVRISQPSERYEPPPPETPRGRPTPPVIKWREPSVFDVFGPSGVYIGRIAAPYDLQLMGRSGGEVIQTRGDVVWGFVRDADGVEAIRRYRIAW